MGKPLTQSFNREPEAASAVDSIAKNIWVKAIRKYLYHYSEPTGTQRGWIPGSETAFISFRQVLMVFGSL